MTTERKLRVCLMPTCRGQRRDLVHKFPMNNDRAEQWRQIINDPQLMDEDLDSIRKKRFICNRHFRQQDYKNVASRGLNTTAVPSLLLDRTAATLEKATTAADTDEPNTTVVYVQTADDGDDAYELDTNNVPTSMRLEINFDTVVHASDLKLIHQNSSSKSDATATASSTIEYIEHIGLSDDDLMLTDDTLVSILEPSLDKANTYRLMSSTLTKATATAATTTTHHHHQSAAMAAGRAVGIKVQCDNNDNGGGDGGDDDDHDGDADGNNDSSDEHETSDVLLIPLSSESFMNLQNRLLQQQQQSDSEKPNEIVLDDILMECNRSDDTIRAGRFHNGDFDMSPSASFDSTTTTVTSPTWSQSLQICHFWLRDHCRCALCYNADTFQRKQNVLDIPLNIKPLRIGVTDTKDSSELRITWPDQHESVYDLTALRAHYGDTNAAATALPPITERHLWTSDDIKTQPYARVTLNDLLCEDAVARAIVTSLVRYGVAFIEKVPPNLQSTEVAVKRLFAVHKTLFGEMWSLSDSQEHADTAYSKTHLGAHTDNTYFNDASGLQVLHCVTHTGDGGESLLLDGFQAVQALRKRNAAAVERLSRTNVPAEYLEEGQHHTYDAPIVRLTPDGTDLEQLRFNLYDRAQMTAMSPAETHQFYSDLRQLTAEIQAPSNEWWFKLQPGTVMIFDNWRLLHGRAAYTGRRQLVGCYVSRTEFQSVARTMGVIR